MTMETLKIIATALEWYEKNGVPAIEVSTNSTNTAIVTAVSTPSTVQEAANALKAQLLAFTKLHCQTEAATLAAIQSAMLKADADAEALAQALNAIVKKYHELLDLLTDRNVGTNMPRVSSPNVVATEVSVTVTTIPASSGVDHNKPIDVSRPKLLSLETLKEQLQRCDQETHITVSLTPLVADDVIEMPSLLPPSRMSVLAAACQEREGQTVVGQALAENLRNHPDSLFTSCVASVAVFSNTYDYDNSNNDISFDINNNSNENDNSNNSILNFNHNNIINSCSSRTLELTFKTAANSQVITSTDIDSDHAPTRVVTSKKGGKIEQKAAEMAEAYYQTKWLAHAEKTKDQFDTWIRQQTEPLPVQSNNPKLTAALLIALQAKGFTKAYKPDVRAEKENVIRHSSSSSSSMHHRRLDGSGNVNSGNLFLGGMGTGISSSSNSMPRATLENESVTFKANVQVVPANPNGKK